MKIAKISDVKKMKTIPLPLKKRRSDLLSDLRGRFVGPEAGKMTKIIEFEKKIAKIRDIKMAKTLSLPLKAMQYTIIKTEKSFSGV